MILCAGLLMCSGCKPTSPPPEQASNGAETSPPMNSPALNSSPPAHTSSAPAPPVDAEYAQLLQEIVDDEGLVRYDLLDDPARQAALKGVLDRMADESMPEDTSQRLALLCNAYNANALFLTYEASRQPEFKTVNDVPGFFDGYEFMVAKSKYTLDRLKDDIRALKDPRIHCALVWGAKGCPPLLNEPLAADRLDEQFASHCKRWIEERSKNTTLNTRLKLSDIFKQHEEDFKVEPYGDYRRFIYKFAQPNGMMRAHINHLEKGVELQWWPFDWNLNESAADAAGSAKKE